MTIEKNICNVEISLKASNKHLKIHTQKDGMAD